MNNIFLVDNNTTNLNLLTSIFKKDGYNVMTAASGEEALTKIKTFAPDIIMLEIGLTDINGFMLYAKIKEIPNLDKVPTIFTSTSTSTSDKIKGYNMGAVDYIQKPYNAEEIKLKIKANLKIQEEKGKIEEQITLKNDEIKKQEQTLVYAIGRISQIRDDNSGKHIERIQLFSKMLAEELQKNPSYQPQITPHFIKMLNATVPFHDIGKVAIPDSILLKTDKLSPDEQEIMKQHVVIGANLIENIIKSSGHNELLEMGRAIVKHHHEKWDGTGYPDRLSSSHIPLAARITSVTTMYDFLRSAKAYKPAYTHQQACNGLLEEKGKALDPHIVDAFMNIQHKIEEAYLKVETQNISY